MKDKNLRVLSANVIGIENESMPFSHPNEVVEQILPLFLLYIQLNHTLFFFNSVKLEI